MFAFGGMAAAKSKGTSVEVKGKYYETCGCKVSCPCATNEFLPSEGHCDAMMFFHLDKASVGATKLDGFNLVAVLKSPQNRKIMEAFQKGEMDHFAFYFDDKATEEQRKAIPQLMEAMFGKMEIKGAKAPVFVPIKLTAEGDTATVDVAGGKLTADIVNIKVGETKNGAKIESKHIGLDGAVPFPWVVKTTQGKSNSFHYVDGPVKWDYKDRNAFFGEISHKATLAAAAEPAAK
jgi:hypothetical protein